MALAEQTTQLFEQTKCKLRQLFRQHMTQATNDGHHSYAINTGEQKEVVLQNKHGETLFVPENSYNTCLGIITAHRGRPEIIQATGLNKFTLEDTFWLREIDYILRDYKPGVGQK